MKIKQQAVQNLRVKTTVKAGSCNDWTCHYGIGQDEVSACVNGDDVACETIGYTVIFPMLNSGCEEGVCMIPS